MILGYLCDRHRNDCVQTSVDGFSRLWHNTVQSSRADAGFSVQIISRSSSFDLATRQAINRRAYMRSYERLNLAQMAYDDAVRARGQGRGTRRILLPASARVLLPGAYFDRTLNLTGGTNFYRPVYVSCRAIATAQVVTDTRFTSISWCMLC